VQRTQPDARSVGKARCTDACSFPDRFAASCALIALKGFKTTVRLQNKRSGRVLCDGARLPVQPSVRAPEPPADAGLRPATRRHRIRHKRLHSGFRVHGLHPGMRRLGLVRFWCVKRARLPALKHRQWLVPESELTRRRASATGAGHGPLRVVPEEPSAASALSPPRLEGAVALWRKCDTLSRWRPASHSSAGWRSPLASRLVRGVARLLSWAAGCAGVARVPGRLTPFSRRVAHRSRSGLPGSGAAVLAQLADPVVAAACQDREQLSSLS
jgi:hypothetical protein